MHRMSPDRLLRVREAADRLAISEGQIRRLAREGKIPSVKLGACVRFRPEDIEAAMNVEPARAAS